MRGRGIAVLASALAGFALTTINPAYAQRVWTPRWTMTCSQGNYEWRTWYLEKGDARGGELYVKGKTYPLTYQTQGNRGYWNETTGTGYIISIGGNYDDMFRLYKGNKIVYSNCKRSEG